MFFTFCAQSNVENRIKKQQVDLFSQSHIIAWSGLTDAWNQKCKYSYI